MLIVGGTSLTVWPASSYISYFKGKHLVIINKEHVSVQLLGENDMFIYDGLGNVFNEVDKALFGE